MSLHAIVTCVTADWMPAAAVTLLSCVTHGKVQDMDLVMCVHQPAAQDLADLAQFSRRHNINITALAIDATELRAIESGPLNIGTLIRLGIDRYLPSTYQRVVYLDSDVLVRRPLAPLFATDMNGFAVAAVTDYMMHSNLYGVLTSNMETIGFDEGDAYFNAGVMLFDWPATLRDNVIARALDLVTRPTHWIFPDQNALNIILRGRWKQLAGKWNVHSTLDDVLPVAAAIRHFTDHRKPWLESCRDRDRVYHRYYRDALRDTPWSRFVHVRDWSLRQITHYWRHYHDADRRQTRAILRATLAKYSPG